MTRRAPADSPPIQQAFTREDGAGANWAHDAVSLSPNVTATVTAEGHLPLAPRGATPITRSDELGHVRARGDNVSLDSETGKGFVTDCARNTEGLLTDQQLKEAWGLDESEWTGLAENTPLLNAIKAERERRIRSGEAAREAAQRHFAGAPSVLNQILHNETISPRHRIEAAKELRQVASSAPEDRAAAGEKFVISIDLGGDCRLVKGFDLPTRIPCDDGEAQ
jgi:hypothetical protein